VNFEISPQPSDAERKAILAALQAEEAERERSSAWADALLPQREGEEPEPA
jgi:hypothetical protein